MKKRFTYIVAELVRHMPFSIFGVTAAIVLMGLLTFLVRIVQAESLLPAASEDLFHIFHPVHLLFSAIATTAMFYKHDNRNIFKAVVIGFLGSVSICGLSDIIIPFVGGVFLGTHMHFHVCIIEEPGLVYPFVALGIMAGLFVTKTFEKSTEFSHSVHVFLSSVASLLYLIAFGLGDWMHAISGVFLVTVFAVMFPCCFSDIVFPLCCTHRYCQHEHDDTADQRADSSHTR